MSLAPDTSELEGEHRSDRAGRLLRLPAAMDPVIIGLFGAAVGLVGVGRPSFWYDEAATISASYSRSLHQLWQTLGHVDAVHGTQHRPVH